MSPVIEPRRFKPGDSGVLDGLRWRVQPGTKLARRDDWQDLVLMAQVPSERMVPMSWLFLMADFLSENEDALFPPEQYYDGGDKLLAYIQKARNGGWVFASESLEIDKVLAADKRRSA